MGIKESTGDSFLGVYLCDFVGFIFVQVGSIVAGITSFSFLEGLDITSPDGRAGGGEEVESCYHDH